MRKLIVKGLSFFVIGVLFYFAFLSTEYESFRNYGSCCEKQVTSTLFDKKVQFKENAISNYVFKEKLHQRNSFTLISSRRFGFLGINFSNYNYRVNREEYIIKVEKWLIRILEEKKDDIQYQKTVINPIIVKFLKALEQRNLEVLQEIVDQNN